MHKTRKEEWEMLKTQIRAQEDTFKKLCVGVHAKQLKDLEANFIKLVHFCKAMQYFIALHFYNLWEGDYNPFKIFKVDHQTTKLLKIGHNLESL